MNQVQQLQRRYDDMEPRDKLALKGLAGFLLALIFYFGLWVPANEFRTERQQSYEKYQTLLQYMRSTEKQARALNVSAPASSDQNLMSSVSNSTQRAGIKPNRLQPEGDSGVSVWFDGVGFAALIQWLQTMDNSGVSVRQISIDREDEAGLVNARIILEG